MRRAVPLRALAGAATALGLDLLLSGCAIGAIAAGQGALAATAVPASVSACSVAGAVDVTGRRGRMGAAQREALIRQLGAQGSANDLNRHLLAMAALGEVDLHAHNEAVLLIDGPRSFAAMFAAIAQARHSVLLQSYIIDDAALAQRLAALLVRKKAQGVGVAVLYDDLGSIGTPRHFLATLKAAGIATCAFNPLSPFSPHTGYWSISHRDHRKILSVDRATGFTGGINISAVYASGSFGRVRVRSEADTQRSGWRDTQVRLRGTAVAALEDLMRDTWASQGCRGALPALARPGPLPAAAADVVRIVPSGPGEAESRIYQMLLHAIDTSTTSVHLTMAYFAPGQEMIDALCEAAQRGVDVRLVLPSVSDFAPVLHAGRSHYQRLLEAGARLYELDDAVLHAKTAVIDGVVSTVGSSNMDWRSFVANNEVNAVVFGERFGAAMAEVFQQDLVRSTAVDAAQWAQRPLMQRAREALARLFERWW